MSVTSCCCQAQHLSPQELVVIELVAAGLSNQQIGRALSVSPHTVASQIATAMKRLEAQNRAELVARSYVTGLLAGQAWPPVSTGRRCLPSQRGSSSHHVVK